MRLATALEVPITAFFQDGADETTVFTRHNQGPKTQGIGVTVESLGTGLREQLLEAFTVTVAARGGNTDDPIAHQGEELVRCLRGEIEYRVGDQVFQMSPGDSLLFEAAQPHCFRNLTDREAEFLIVFQAEEEGAFARRRHLTV